MGHRHLLGYPHSGLESVLLFPHPIRPDWNSTLILAAIALCSLSRLLGRHPTALLPSRPTLGALHAEEKVIWCFIESGSIHHQRACPHHRHGQCRRFLRVCRTSSFRIFRCPPNMCAFLQTDIIAVQRVFYNQTYNFSYQWLLVMSTQLVRHSPHIFNASNLVRTDRLFHRRHRPPVLGQPSVHLLSIRRIS